MWDHALGGTQLEMVAGSLLNEGWRLMYISFGHNEVKLCVPSRQHQVGVR